MSSTNALAQRAILLVNPGSFRKKFILERMKELGLVVVCLHTEKTELAMPYVDYWITADLSNYAQCADQVKAFTAAHPDVRIGGVITFWDECTLLVAHLAEAFHFVGIPFSVAEKIKNKYTFRDFCLAHQLSAPRHQLLRSSDADVAIDPAIRFPCVLKPVYGASSAFVVKVNTEEEMRQSLAAIKAKLHTYELAPEWLSWDILLEEYIDGDEVDVDVLLQDGVMKFFSITDNNKTNEPYFVETGEGAPSSLPQTEQDELMHMVTEAFRVFGVANGCFHFEAKMSSRGPVPIEINMRMGGGDVYLFSLSAWGVDLIENAVKVALGIPLGIQKPEKPLMYLASQQFLPDHSGVLTKLQIDEAIKSKPYFVELYFQKKVGDTFLAPPDGYDSCLGWVTVQGKDAAEARKHVEEAMKYVTYTLEKPSQK